MTFNYGQFIGRSFFRAFVNGYYDLCKIWNNTQINFLKYVCRIQSYFVIILIFFGIYILFPGSFSSSLKDKVLSKHAMGYSLFKWANGKLSDNDVVFISSFNIFGNV